MAEKPAKKTPKKATTPRKRTKRRTPPTHDQIAERAYFIHLEEGGGDAVEDWLRAERELSAA